MKEHKLYMWRLKVANMSAQFLIHMYKDLPAMELFNVVKDYLPNSSSSSKKLKSIGSELTNTYIQRDTDL